MTSLTVAVGLASGADRGLWAAILGVIGIVSGIGALFALKYEWLTECRRLLREGAALLWPVATEAHQRISSDTERAALNRLAARAEPPGGNQDADLMHLAEYCYPMTAKCTLNPSERDHLERGRAMIRDAVERLCGSRLRCYLSAKYIQRSLGPRHRGTCILYWYIQVALARQIGLSRVARHDAIEAMVRAVGEEESEGDSG